jgi:hypothetical protein
MLAGIFVPTAFFERYSSLKLARAQSNIISALWFC